MRYLLTITAIVFGLIGVASSADARTLSDTRKAKVEKHLTKKAQHLLTKTQTKLTKHATKARRVAHIQKHAKRKALHIVKKAKRKGILPVADAGPSLPNANPLRPRTDNALVRTAVMQVGTNPTGWSHNWCGYYLSQVLVMAGYKPGPNLASAYASYGSPAPAQVGAIAVLPHHVGVVAAIGNGYVTLVSGNHGGTSGHRTVGFGRYPIDKIMAFRLPA